MSPETTAAVAISCLLLGCAIPQAQVGAPGKVLVVDDQFQPFREYRSGPVVVKRYQFAMGLTLIGRLDRKTRKLSTHLKVELVYKDIYRRHYNVARNSRAETLDLTRLTASGSCKNGIACAHDEVFTIQIPVDQLRQAPAEGYHLKFFAKVGTSIAIEIAQKRIHALFARIDADRRGGKRKAAE